MRLRLFGTDDYWLELNLKQIKTADELKSNHQYTLAKNGEYVSQNYFMEVRPFKGKADQDTWVPTEAPSACFTDTDLYATDRQKLFKMCQKQGLQIYDQVGEENEKENTKKDS